MPEKTIKIAKKENSTILTGLNKAQTEAVKSINGPVLVIAGAGSGKTRVLTHRIAYLIESGVKPWQILALTFTNKAAKEMKERIGGILSEDLANQVWAGTFHSIFSRILRYEADKLGFTSAFSIYDTDDSNRVIKKVMGRLGIQIQQYPIQAMRSRISMAKNQMISWQEYANNAETLIEKQTGLVYENYDKELAGNNAMDFDDLLLNFIVLLRKDKDVLRKYQDRFKYILVDEYQDTNRAQYIAINLLAKAYQNICVVGDDAQSIYKWRGADIKNILDFQKDYPYAKTIRLEQNYRSTKTILKAADSVIQHNKKQIPKTLWTENNEGEKISLHFCSDEKDEAFHISNMIKKKINADFEPKDIAILYRTNAQSMAIENNLRKTGVKYQIIGGVSFYKRKEIKDSIAYLRLLANPKDSEALERIVNDPPRGLGQTSLKHLRDFAARYNISMLEAFERAEENGKLQKRAIKSATNFFNFVNSYYKLQNELPPAKLAMQYIEETGMSEMYKEINTEEALDRWNNIQQLLSDISNFYRNSDSTDIADYLQQISLVSDVDEKDDSENKITLMTLHSAKGLEFPVVFIAGMEQGLFPLIRSDSTFEEEEEERRLFYVGITRAKEQLFLTHAKQRARFGEVQYQQASYFLKEIDENLIIKTGEMNKRQQTYSHRNISKPKPKPQQRSSNFFDDMSSGGDDYSQIPQTQESLSIGDYVKHSQFGKGKIVQMSGQGKYQKAVVLFESIGRKQLMVAFAKLEKL